MSAEIIKVFEYIGDKLGIAIDWTQDNIMPYLKDLITRFVKLNIIEEVICIAVSALLLIGCIVLGSVIVSKYYKCKSAEGTKGDSIFWITKEYHYHDDEIEMTAPAIISTIFIVVFAIIAMVLLPISIGELIRWIYVPEIQIFEEVKSIMSGVTA